MPTYLVRYGAMRMLDPFDAPDNMRLTRDMRVIVRSSRGMEAGVVLGQMQRPVDEADERKHGRIGRVVRVMTADDERDLQHIRDQQQDELKTCEKIVKRMNIEMDLVQVEHIFGGERIVIHYLADGRVDFRELVKVLASEFQTRIEMRQIGVRDEAKLLADYGDCGKPVCCNNHLIQMPPVSMKMAKLQKATLDPTKISGRCGRLKCCLRYEYDTYREIVAELPPIGCQVECSEGAGRIVGQEILAEQVVVELENRTRKLIPVEDITIIERASSRSRPKRSGGGRPKNDKPANNNRPKGKPQ